MRHRFEAAHGAMEDRRGVLLELRDDAGHVGVGEASPIPSLGYGTVEDVLTLLATFVGDGTLPHLLDVVDPHTPGVMALLCALDVAGLDLEGRRAGRSVASLLAADGAHVVPSARVNAVIGDGTPEETARFGVEATAQGYDVLKTKVGAGELAQDFGRIVALRAACPDATIRLDANGAWDEATALQAARSLAQFGIELIEQPVAAGDVAALRRVRDAVAGSPLIAADEAVTDPSTLARVLAERAADLVVLKPMFLGGLRPALDVARRAEARGLSAIVTTTFDSSIGTAAALHLAAVIDGASGEQRAHGLGTGEHLAADLVTHTMLARDGMLAVPTGAGLGVAPDDEAWHRVAEGDWSEWITVSS